MIEFILSPVDAAQLAAKVLAYAAALAAVGALAFIDAFRPFLLDSEVAVVKRHLGGLLVVALLASLATLYTTVAVLNGLGLAGGFDAELWGLVAGTSAGDAVWMRLIGLAILLFGLLVARLRLAAAVLGGLTVAVSFGFIGHVQDDEHTVFLHALLMLHLLAIAFWIGSLWPLQRLAGVDDPRRMAELMERFGQLAVYFVVCLLGAGFLLAWMLLDGLAPLITTDYGRLLLVKLAMVGLLFCLAALNKWRLVPALAAGDRTAGPRLRRSIFAEIGLVGLVVLVTGLLTTAVSPH